MEIIEITTEMSDFVAQQAPRLDLGGFSNLKKADLSKSSRLGFQYTGLYGEVAWYCYRYGGFDRLSKLLDEKQLHHAKTGKGDDGHDDSIMFKNKQRLIDIKSSHCTDFSQIMQLNLVIPPRELHDNMIYVAAYTIGPDKQNREDVKRVVLAGWCFNEEVKDRWYYDSAKFAVKVKNLHPMSELINVDKSISISL